MKALICVHLTHHTGKRSNGLEFSLHKSNHPTIVEIVDGEEEASLTSGNLSVKISKNEDWNIDYVYAGKRITGSGYKSPGYIKKMTKRHLCANS